MNPIRSLSILALFVLASASAFAATADLNVIITVNITNAVSLQWSADSASTSRYWLLKDVDTNTSYDSDATPTANLRLCSDALWTTPVADGLSVKNASQRPVSLTIAVTAQATWTHNVIANHISSVDVYTIRAATGATHALDGNVADGSITAGPDFTLALATIATPVALAASVAKGVTQPLRLEFITPLDVSAGNSAATMTVTVHGTAL